jgi:hypothetical protein
MDPEQTDVKGFRAAKGDAEGAEVPMAELN